MSLPIALQLYSVRDDLEKDFKGTLRNVKSLGYDGIEFAGLYGHKPAEIKEILKDIGLVSVSAHVPFTDLIADPEKVIREYAEIGCKYVVIPYLTEAYHPGAEKFNEVIEGAKILGIVAKDLELVLLYHNHDFEFKKINGEYALDILYKSVPADLLQTEVDTCWVNVAGQNPSAYLRKYSGRSPLVHLKDFVMPGKKPEKMYDLIGISDGKKGEDAESFEFRPLGQGVQNFTEILKACTDIGASWVIIEQDEPSMGKTPIECAEMSIKYIKSL
jgi:sugar phosphate isomerase/epimerase